MSSLSSAHQRAGLEARHWLTRIESELSVAQQLAELHSDRKEAWLALSARASAHVEAAAGRGLESLRAAVLEAEELLAPVGAVAKTYVVHCVGHAHIDMNWMWSWPETVSVINDTFSTVLGLLDEYPEFCFSQSQASVYRAVEKHNPEMLARIADYVRRGRWEVTASHWVECDKNLVSGESLCRHLLYTRMYMQELFGLTPDDVPIDWAPDTFGHAATVPGYLVRGGVRYVYLHRPGVHTKEKPDAFIWQGLDGSQVLVKNDMRLGYNGVITPDVARHAFGFAQATGCPSSLFVYGVGDHGGGPTRQDIERARDMNSWPIFPELRFDRAVAFFRKLEECSGLPVIHGELNTEFTGCYSSQSLIKKANRFSENRLFDAEFAACIAWAASGKSYPEAALISSWRDTLFSQFHDILPGSGVHDTRTYTHGLYQEVMATATMIETTALRGLAQRVATSELAGAAARKGHLPAEFTVSGLGGGAGSFCADGRLSVAEVNNDQGARPFVLFNPTLWDRDEVVEVFVWDRAVEGLPPIQNEQFSVRAPDGARLPVQAVGRGHDWGHQYVKLAFPVKVQGLGYATYLVEPTERPLEEPQPRVTALDPHHHCSYARPERAGFGLENQFLRVTLDPQTGFIGSLFDRRSGLELMQQAPSSNGILFGVERPHG
ncbi:MAG TPA: hypothetical protein VGJ84_03340, partial [Polyangiaceae bacterium]